MTLTNPLLDEELLKQYCLTNDITLDTDCLQILNLGTNEIITYKEIETKLSVHYQTARNKIQYLVQTKLLISLPKVKRKNEQRFTTNWGPVLNHEIKELRLELRQREINLQELAAVLYSKQTYLNLLRGSALILGHLKRRTKVTDQLKPEPHPQQIRVTLLSTAKELNELAQVLNKLASTSQLWRDDEVSHKMLGSWDSDWLTLIAADTTEYWEKGLINTEGVAIENLDYNLDYPKETIQKQIKEAMGQDE